MPDSVLSRVTAPAVPLVSLAEIKAQLRVDHDDEDGLIAARISAATSFVEGILGRGLITQSWRLTLPTAPSGPLSLPLPPVQSVSSITYYDEANASQTFAANQYRLILATDSAVVELVDGASWPTIYNRSDAMAVEFVAGFGDRPEDVPEEIRLAVSILAAHWYEHRGVMGDSRAAAMPFGVPALLMNHRLARGYI